MSEKKCSVPCYFKECLTVRRRCAADSYLRLTDCVTQSDWLQHFVQTKPNCPAAPRAGQLLRILSLQYTKSVPMSFLSNCPPRSAVGQLGFVSVTPICVCVRTCACMSVCVCVYELISSPTVHVQAMCSSASKRTPQIQGTSAAKSKKI